MRTILKYVACTVAALVAVTLVGPTAAAQESLARPDWAAIFAPDGTVVSLQGGIDAFFLKDKISDGVGIDMTVLVPGTKPAVGNSVVAAFDDLGNGYVWARTDSGGNLQIYAGVERLDSGAGTYVEFEFNQDIVRVRQGIPWPIHGARTPNDILVRVSLAGGSVDSAVFMRWDGSAFQPVAAAGPGGGSSPIVLVNASAPPQDSAQADVWDAAYNLVQVPRPNSFVEVGFNVAALLGTNVQFTSLQVRTAEDLSLGSFARIGQYAPHGTEGGGQ